MADQNIYDFIIVGGGTAGCVIASRLASSAKKPRVLLLEAGGPNTGLKHRAAGERMMYWMFAEQNYRQKTDPEPVLGNRELLYYRSRGLGGTTVINLGVWDYGRREEYEKWARIVGDDVWSWDSAVAKMKKIESFHDKTPQDLREYVPDHKQNHGSDGPLDVSYPATWGPGLKLVLEGAKRQRFRLADLYSGDLGMGVSAVTAYNGLRTTASTAYLSDPPSNLHILTDTVVTRVMFEGNRAIGVQLADGTKYLANREVIVCAGSIDTPKLLLLSGIGPSEELAKHSIQPTAVVPGIGHNLGDHCMASLRANLARDTIPLLSMTDMRAAKAQWEADQTGPLLDESAMIALGYFQVDNIQSFPELQALDEQTREHLTRPQTAHFELSITILPIPDAPKPVLITTIILLNAMSRGMHAYDWRVLTEAVKVARKYVYESDFPLEEQALGPAGWGDEDVSSYLQQSVSPAWHTCGTVKMGKPGDEGTCVDDEFRVVGLSNLRVADLSVCPVIPSNHTQATAYLIGEVAAEKLMMQYNL